jgi:hypothetical protein
MEGARGTGSRFRIRVPRLIGVWRRDALAGAAGVTSPARAVRRESTTHTSNRMFLGCDAGFAAPREKIPGQGRKDGSPHQA